MFLLVATPLAVFVVKVPGQSGGSALLISEFRGHFLCANSVGYSLAAYPAGNRTTATPDVSYTLNIADNAGFAVFSTSNAANYNLSTRFDAAGSTSEANALYKEGVGYPAIVPFQSTPRSIARTVL